MWKGASEESYSYLRLNQNENKGREFGDGAVAQWYSTCLVCAKLRVGSPAPILPPKNLATRPGV
jgi:hypothetical protein